MAEESKEMERFVPPGSASEMAPSVVSRDQTGLIEARIRAEVQVRTMQAIARPRDLDTVREKLLKDARRPGFADTAEYAVPRGGTTIYGASIRFVEAAIAALGNIMVDVAVIVENDENRFCEVTLADLENNSTYKQAFVVSKTIERKKLQPNTKPEDVIGTRTNSEGQMLYILKAPESEMAMKQGAAASKIIRTLGLRLLPGDIKEEALDVCADTRKNRDAKDPDAARRKLIDAFAKLGVKVADLKDYVGHSLETMSPPEIDSLRKVYLALNDGLTTWTEITGQAEKAEAEKANPATKAAEAVKAKLNIPPKATVNVVEAEIVKPMTKEEEDAAEKAYQIQAEKDRAAQEDGKLV